MRTRHITRLCLAAVFTICLGVHTANAEGKMGGWLKEKIQERKASKSADGENPMRMDDSDGGSCAKRAKQMSRMMDGPMGKKAYGPKADIKDVAYGEHERQKVDVFLPTTNTPDTLAPIIIMVHGGGWCVGDKAIKGTTGSKTKRWLPKGFMFVSVNYPMLQDGSVAVDQGEDVARAIAYVQKHAKEWGGDAERVILMGHSAGAHLVSLVNANAEMRERQGVTKILGTISLDSGATNVVTQMPNAVPAMKGRYKEAFGTTETEWIAASPYHFLDKTASPWLGVCSTTRPDNPCGQAREYAEKSNGLGVSASVLPLAKGHGTINKEIGEAGDYTDKVEKFMASLDPVVSNLLKQGETP